MEDGRWRTEDGKAPSPCPSREGRGGSWMEDGKSPCPAKGRCIAAMEGGATGRNGGRGKKDNFADRGGKTDPN